MLAVASLFGACEPSASNNASNKPGNTGNSANSAKPVDTSAIETEVKKLVSDVSASLSKNDVAAFEKMTVDSYKFINPNGQVSTRAERAAAMKSGESKYESVVYDDVSVNVHPNGSGAIVIGRATVKGVNMGTKVDGQFRFTQLWGKSDDGWKMVHGHATAITGGSSPPSNSSASNSAASNSAADEKANTNQ